MGKLKDLASVKSSKSSSFAYLPPDTAFDAMRILVKPQLDYSSLSPASVSLDVLGAVLRGLRRASPHGRIVVIDGITDDKGVEAVFEELGIVSLLDKEMRITDSDNLIMLDYQNRLAEPLIYPSMTASGYIREYDCVISLAAFKRTTKHDRVDISASLHNLRGIFPPKKYQDDFATANVNDLLTDIYFTIGHHIDGAVIDLSQKYADGEQHPVGRVVWGEDLLAVDEVACQLADEAPPEYIESIRKRRKTLAR